jgi:DNA-directed RNA polymerase sigma subunit (sigma70/sigma32)
VTCPDVEVWEMTETCTLDVAERDGATLEEVGELMNITRERVRQIGDKALAKVGEFVKGEE